MSDTRCTCGLGHLTFGACVRAKGIRIGWCQSVKGLDATAERLKDRELALYKSARDQRIQPDGTTTAQVERALEMSDRTGRAYDGGKFDWGLVDG